ncbi:MAG: heme ABC exporter ATP-binding protein CcmA [Anaerolineales bacterium]|nr:heme ABC exporter ATP-binding protein CcmA [Anaerolineales bacterium]
MIQVSQLSKRFGYRMALHGVNLRVGRGEMVALLGPNGAGKSTLLRILAGLAQPTAGRVQVAGCLLPKQAAAARAQVGYLGHQPLLYDELTADQNLEFFARLYAVPSAQARIDELLVLVGLDHRRREAVRGYSRGMLQRLALARALLHRPRVLLLDEPHSALDLQTADLLDGVLRAEARAGVSILIASHDLGRVGGLAQRAELLADGRIVATLPKAKLGRKLPAHYARALEAANG